MSTTMMNHSRRQILMPRPSSSSNKRKERDGLFDGFKPSQLTTKNLAKPSIHRPPPAPVKSRKMAAAPAVDNKLLAGYLAHEFLTNGTLFGESWSPVEEVPVSATPSRWKFAHSDKTKADVGDERKPSEKEQRYLEVADLLRADGVHIQGIVNPTELARFLKLG